MTAAEIQRQEKEVKDWIATLGAADKAREQQRFDRIKKLPRAEYLQKLRNFLKATTTDVAKSSDVDTAYSMLSTPQSWGLDSIKWAANKVIDFEKPRNNMVRPLNFLGLMLQLCHSLLTTAIK